MLFVQTAIVTAFHLGLTWWLFDAGALLSSLFPSTLLGTNFRSIPSRPMLRFARYSKPRATISRSTRVESWSLENATTSYVHCNSAPTREAFTPAESLWFTPLQDTSLVKATKAFSSPETCLWAGESLQLITLCNDLDAPPNPTHILPTHTRLIPDHSPPPAIPLQRPLHPPLPLSQPGNYSTKYRAPAACSPSVSASNSSFGRGSPPPPQFEDDLLAFFPSDMYLLLSDLFLFYVGYQVFKRLMRGMARHLNQLLADFFAFRAPGILESMSFSSTGSVAALARNNTNTNMNHVTVERQERRPNNASSVNDIQIHAPLARYWFDPPTVVRMDAAPVAESSPIISVRRTGQDGRNPLIQGDLSSSNAPIDGLNHDVEQGGNTLVNLDGRESRLAPEDPAHAERQVKESPDACVDSETTLYDDVVTKIAFSLPPSNSQVSVKHSQENSQYINCSLCVMDTTFILNGKTRACAHGYQSLASDYDEERVADHGFYSGHQVQGNDANRSISTVDHPQVQEMGVIQNVRSVNVPDHEFEELVHFERQEQARSEEELEFIDLTQNEPYDYQYRSTSSRSQASAMPHPSNHAYQAPPRTDPRWRSAAARDQTYLPQAGTGSAWRYYPAVPTLPTQQWASLPVAVPIPVPVPPPQYPWNLLDEAHGFDFVGPPANATSVTYDYGYYYNQYGYRSDRTWIADDIHGTGGSRQRSDDSDAYGGFEDEHGYWQSGRGRRECATSRKLDSDRPCVKCRYAGGAKARRDSDGNRSLRGKGLGGFGCENRN